MQGNITCQRKSREHMSTEAPQRPQRAQALLPKAPGRTKTPRTGG